MKYGIWLWAMKQWKSIMFSDSEAEYNTWRSSLKVWLFSYKSEK